MVPSPHQTDLLALADEYTVGSHHSTACTCTEGSHSQFQMGRSLSFYRSIFLDPLSLQARVKEIAQSLILFIGCGL